MATLTITPDLDKMVKKKNIDTVNMLFKIENRLQG